ncbi:hypothetical protein BJH93_10560 [Kocuria polaris]|nr:hypothetical protein [Kocuria polaris]
MIVTGQPRERSEWIGVGESRTRGSRVTDDQGRPVSGVAVVTVDGLGEVWTDATVLVPDHLCEEILPGAVIDLSGNLVADLRGGDFGVIRKTVHGVEGVTVVGSLPDLLAATGKKVTTNA